MTPQPDPAREKVFSVADIAFYHDTIPEEVVHVVVEMQNLALSQYNFVRIQRTLRVTPERAAGITEQG